MTGEREDYKQGLAAGTFNGTSNTETSTDSFINTEHVSHKRSRNSSAVKILNVIRQKVNH